MNLINTKRIFRAGNDHRAPRLGFCLLSPVPAWFGISEGRIFVADDCDGTASKLQVGCLESFSVC